MFILIMPLKYHSPLIPSSLPVYWFKPETEFLALPSQHHTSHLVLL